MVRLIGILALAISCIAGNGIVRAQGSDGTTAPAESAVGAEFKAKCQLNGLNCKLVYGESAETASRPGRDSGWASSRGPLVSGPAAMVMVIAMLAIGIGLWLRFGGGGALLSSTPRELKHKTVAPDGWAMRPDGPQSQPSDLLDRIAAMSDQRAAMIELLRHCLLHAADVSVTQFARSDTERSALARLPGNLPGRPLLEELLVETELVHYGGRNLPKERFAALLGNARRLLNERPPAHA
ncbi:hypothetical protein [Aquamicrobium defluvii]|uniref:DUF4129 domain-containing protein n=1 Tax=Aquamicrobium defluvii TaxID=69279 RepID=A0A011U8N0_9HYPH|nr:hypothetical protein [Aquamicrobium defluvii]EXL02426.1 hypothetical protein BG36_15190 [Aquamicrobium defluvii]EZQ13079.1 hypothetical protein CF98_29495 [Halopseudomonas bauzanensis]TDR32939.1 hypothetical protein DES43_12569 [Aquamicrobium defluvii]